MQAIRAATSEVVRSLHCFAVTLYDYDATPCTRATRTRGMIIQRAGQGTVDVRS
jgi:hypothetical protein